MRERERERERFQIHVVSFRRSCNTAGSMNRLGALEARATKRAKVGQTLYLPVIFIGYGLLLGKSLDTN